MIYIDFEGQQMTFPLVNLLIEFNQNHCFGLI